MGRSRFMRRPRNLSIQETEEMLEKETNNGKDLTLLSAVNAVITLAEDSELKPLFFKRAHSYIKFLAEREGITDIQAVLLSVFVETSAGGMVSDLSDIARYLACNNVEILQHKEEVEALVKRGMLRQKRNNMSGNVNYVASQAMLDSLTKNEPYHQKTYKNSTGIEFFQHFYDITHMRYEGDMSTDIMIEEVERLIAENPQLPYVKAINSTKLSIMEKIVLTHMCRHLVLSSTDIVPMDHLTFLFDDTHDRFDFFRAMSEGDTRLFSDGWIENAFSDGFTEKDEFQLTTKTRQAMLSDFKIRQKDYGRCEVLRAEKIATKELFFDDGVRKQIDALSELLEETHYQDICRRLKEKGLRKGFACLFYGAPGTGKTESVLQLARKTGRDIMQVNISEVKSKWVGESEKNIKAIFDRYRTVVRNSERAPILLFNEADAVIGKRQEGAARAVDKMENSIQNIILQEMESLEGIMIATTNLAQNLDAAFERRFLYKVKFDKPSSLQRSKIWQTMLPVLSEDTAVRLASLYDFSGGQIENITRKCGIESVLYGDDYITEDMIAQYCKEEVLEKQTRGKIGFV